MIATDFMEIRDCYKIFEQKIFARFNKSNNISRWIDPYVIGFDFLNLFSHIEMMTWQALRCYGHAPFYPQYPVGKYFLDFGNPIVKVGIECDGKQYHTDKEKDLNRDRNLNELGWTIYRISGSDCNRIINLYEYPDDENPYDVANNRNEYYYKTIEGLIECLAVRYFNQSFFGEPNENMKIMCSVLRERVSVHTDDFDIELSNAVQDCYNKYYQR